MPAQSVPGNPFAPWTYDFEDLRVYYSWHLSYRTAGFVQFRARLINYFSGKNRELS